MAADKPTEKYEEVFEEGEAPKGSQSMHRLRANSSIMQLKKILGKLPARSSRGPGLPGARRSSLCCAPVSSCGGC